MKRGRPKLEQSSDAHRKLQLADRLGLDIKPVKLGKGVVLSPGQIKRALICGQKIRLDGAIIDPTQLPLKIAYRGKITDEHGDSPAGKLFARRFITHEMYETAQNFGTIYAGAFPKRDAKAADMEASGGGGGAASLVNERGYQKYFNLCERFTKSGKKYHLCHLVQFAYNDDPPWIDAERVPWGGLPTKLKIKAPKGFEYEHRQLVAALFVCIRIMNLGRA